MLDFKALEVYLERYMPVKQQIAVVQAYQGNRAIVKPLGSGTVIDVRVAPGTPLAAGDEVYMIRSKWSPDWIVQTNLGKGNATSNIQNTVPVHAQGTAKAGNVTNISFGAAGSSGAISSSLTQIASFTHTAKSETISLSAFMSIIHSSFTGTPTVLVTVQVDGVDMFPVAGAMSWVNNSSFFFNLCVPMKGIKPGLRTITIWASESGAVAGTFRVYNASVIDE